MPAKKSAKYKSLTLLGRPTAQYPKSPTSKTLETFPNRYATRRFWIRFDCPDFTSVCPITGQPDFAHITIEYIPNALCIETKSLKFYLASYRNTGSFNEEIINRILDDVVTVCQPRQAIVYGDFAARGGISISVDARYPDDATGEHTRESIRARSERENGLSRGLPGARRSGEVGKRARSRGIAEGE
jgi:7-cyano-7-deazaguanine reductase